MEDKQNESIKKKKNENLVGWVTVDNQEKEIAKKRERKKTVPQVNKLPLYKRL